MNSTIKTNFSINELDFQKSGNSLIPAIIQDCTTLKVLMLGYMNREALEKTLDDKKVTFYSRSRERLWTKGESSGNFLFAREILKDCDNDTILIKAEAVGPTCHTGSNSCFNSSDDEGFIRKLQRVIERRKIERPQGSYTVELFDKGVNKIAQKVGEEAVETVIEAIDGNDERLIYEASDLIYHLLVLLACKNMNISDLEKELYKRHK
ncbi:MAG: bifunctional phosphoribosyl-AMP cyclohydrolase/phosphoribosyl-ATP diphosphatase HisIE [Bacteroidales bacterium]|nr:bifunctional phosphoribosyl-AMP cyclohydrolase/phosphoribosyl-ATP diphosphatase HisIE [Bacteroidales bacterium]